MYPIPIPACFWRSEEAGAPVQKSTATLEKAYTDSNQSSGSNKDQWSYPHVTKLIFSICILISDGQVLSIINVLENQKNDGILD